MPISAQDLLQLQKKLHHIHICEKLNCTTEAVKLLKELWLQTKSINAYQLEWVFEAVLYVQKNWPISYSSISFYLSLAGEVVCFFCFFKKALWNATSSMLTTLQKLPGQKKQRSQQAAPLKTVGRKKLVYDILTQGFVFHHILVHINIVVLFLSMLNFKSDLFVIIFPFL